MDRDRLDGIVDGVVLAGALIVLGLGFVTLVVDGLSIFGVVATVWGTVATVRRTGRIVARLRRRSA
jgi:hypothetical protein